MIIDTSSVVTTQQQQQSDCCHPHRPSTHRFKCKVCWMIYGDHIVLLLRCPPLDWHRFGPPSKKELCVLECKGLVERFLHWELFVKASVETRPSLVWERVIIGWVKQSKAATTARPLTFLSLSPTFFDCQFQGRWRIWPQILQPFFGTKFGVCRNLSELSSHMQSRSTQWSSFWRWFPSSSLENLQTVTGEKYNTKAIMQKASLLLCA